MFITLTKMFLTKNHSDPKCSHVLCEKVFVVQCFKEKMILIQRQRSLVDFILNVKKNR